VGVEEFSGSALCDGDADAVSLADADARTDGSGEAPVDGEGVTSGTPASTSPAGVEVAEPRPVGRTMPAR
jgi:hypothetical protein